MSFAAVHMIKCSKSSVGGMESHIQREKESRTNKDIDKTRTELNYDLHNDSNIKYLQKINEIIKNNVQSKRVIKDDAVLMCNFVITSDKGFFDNLSQEQERNFFEKSYEFFAERYGKENIVAAVVHKDEATPHMHLSMVPITTDKKKGIKKLCAKEIFDRKELKNLQDDYPAYMQDKGFKLERGIDAEGKNKHIEIQRFKKESLTKEINNLSQERNTLESDFKALRDMESDIKQVDFFESQKTLLGKIKITEKEFEELKGMAKQSIVLKRANEELESQNRKLHYYSNSQKERASERDKEILSLSLENKELKKQVKGLERLKEAVTEILNELKLKNIVEKINERYHEKKREEEQKKDREKQNRHERSIGR